MNLINYKTVLTVTIISLSELSCYESMEMSFFFIAFYGYKTNGICRT